MASRIQTVRLKDPTDHEWRAACADAYERLKLDPRCEPESIRPPEFQGGSPVHKLYKITCDTKGGDVLYVALYIVP